MWHLTKTQLAVVVPILGILFLLSVDLYINVRGHDIRENILIVFDFAVLWAYFT